MGHHRLTKLGPKQSIQRENNIEGYPGRCTCSIDFLVLSILIWVKISILYIILFPRNKKDWNALI